MLVQKAMRRLGVSLAVAGLSLGFVLSPIPAFADAGFQQWVASFRSVAAKNGITRATYDRAFRGVTAPDPEVIEKARFQPEFTAPVWDYFDNRVHEELGCGGPADGPSVEAVARSH